MKQEKAVTIQIINRVQLNNSADFFERKSAARRILKQGGIYMNNVNVDDENKSLSYC